MYNAGKLVVSVVVFLVLGAAEATYNAFVRRVGV